MSKKKICISVGHGKNEKGKYDPGALSTDLTKQEFKLAKEISKYAAEYIGCDLINYKGDMSLTQRIRYINLHNYSFVAEIHLNAGGGTGTETFYYHGSPTGKRVGTEVCKAISETLGIKNRGIKVKMNSQGQDYFGFIRQTRPCAILIEVCFIDSENDLSRLLRGDNIKKVGQAIGKALLCV